MWPPLGFLEAKLSFKNNRGTFTAQNNRSRQKVFCVFIFFVGIFYEVNAEFAGCTQTCAVDLNCRIVQRGLVHFIFIKKTWPVP